MKKIINEYPFVVALLLLFAFNFCLVFFRIYYIEQGYYGFLIWNLFLAFLPLVFIQMASWWSRFPKAVLLVFFCGMMSLLFLPNSPYIMTDLFHLKNWKSSYGVPLWFDTLLIFSYAITGIILFYATLLSMERLLKNYFSNFWSNSILLTIIFLNAFGIYLGRYMRFNSWDIVADPMSLVVEIADRLVNPWIHGRTWGVTLVYGGLFLVGFICVKLFQKSLLVDGKSLANG